MTSLSQRPVSVRRSPASSVRRLSSARSRAGASAALVACAALACGGDDSPGPGPVPPPAPVATTVEVAPATAELTALGQTVQLSATVRDQNGGVMSGASVNWTSGDPAVATVDAAGLVTAVATGTAAINATSGSASGTASVTVSQASAAVVVTPQSATLSAIGDTARFAAEVQDANGNAIAGAAVSWASADAAVATVDQTGLVTAVAPGTAAIEATSGTASGSGTVAVMQEAATLTVAPGRLRLTALGERAQLTAEAMDANGNAIADPMLNWTSEDDAVATVDAAGFVTAVANGETAVTVTMGSASASARVAVEGGAAPADGPPTPTHPADSVISLFSDTYDDVTVDTWSADWDAADLTDIEIAGNPVKLYTNLSYAGIEFVSQTVDATGMDYFRMDLWTPDGTAPAAFRVKLVDFGADGAFGGGDDSEHEATITAAEGLAPEEWVQLDLWLDDFTNLASRANLAQLIISGDPNTVYVDNVYFRQGAAPPSAPEPVEPAPTPEDAAAGVISLFSDAYDDVSVDTWSAPWDQAQVEDVEVAGDAVKKYTGLSFAGIEFTSATLDASGMTHFRMDIWTPDATAAPAAFKVKLVDFGADGAHGGGDDSEHEVTITAAEGLASEAWVQLDLSLNDFTNLASRANLAQLILSGDPNTVYLDNVYFRQSAAPPPAPEPVAPAPTPVDAATDVISLFSDAYDDVSVDTWSADWDQAEVEDVEVAGDAVKKYTGLSFAGIEFTSATLDASGMTHFRMDIWTPDETAAPAAFKVKLVDFGADGVWSPDVDDTEHELTLTADDGLMTGEWVRLDLPLADFTNLASSEHLAQLIISGDPNTVYVDNVYFRGGEAPPAPEAPTAPAPTPDRSSDYVISIFSDAYADVTVDTWSASWDQADVEDVVIEGDAVKKYTNLTFAGIEFVSQTIDAESMTHLHFDVWTPDPTGDPAAFRVKLVDFGADGAFDGGDDSEHEVSLTADSDPALRTGRWISYDLSLSDLTNLTARGHLAQLIISGDPNTVFLDNVYFFKLPPTAPDASAPAPSHAADDVISFFSDAYSDVTVDTWSASWDQADVEDVEISDNTIKKYTNLTFAGIEFISQTVDAADMTHFRMDIWTPDPTGQPAVFRIKLVDFGADGAFGGGDDSEHEVALTAESAPTALATAQWVSFDIPLSDFASLADRGHLAQLIISGDPNTVFVDNVYLRK